MISSKITSPRSETTDGFQTPHIQCNGSFIFYSFFADTIISSRILSKLHFCRDNLNKSQPIQPGKKSERNIENP